MKFVNNKLILRDNIKTMFTYWSFIYVVT